MLFSMAGAPSRKNALSLKRHLLKMQTQGFLDLFLTAPPLNIFFNFSSSTLKRHFDTPSHLLLQVVVTTKRLTV